jgi:hypothetical protein
MCCQVSHLSHNTVLPSSAEIPQSHLIVVCSSSEVSSAGYGARTSWTRSHCQTASRPVPSWKLSAMPVPSLSVHTIIVSSCTWNCFPAIFVETIPAESSSDSTTRRESLSPGSDCPVLQIPTPRSTHPLSLSRYTLQRLEEMRTVGNDRLDIIGAPGWTPPYLSGTPGGIRVEMTGAQGNSLSDSANWGLAVSGSSVIRESRWTGSSTHFSQPSLRRTRGRPPAKRHSMDCGQSILSNFESKLGEMYFIVTSLSSSMKPCEFMVCRNSRWWDRVRSEKILSL